ncbi:GntR family transcriptional regulator, partial [Acinetobacter baumannii]|uniref:GntR family transcriptional regulator n=1 Tax=Acinetobacter baumannii TaxID=470 RepID=UPI00190A75EF
MPRTSKQEHTELSIEADSPVPLYQRVKQLISQKIYEGSWAVNKKIPSESELVNQLGCSRMTVNRALRELTTEGTVAKLAMRQPFVLFKGLTFQKLCLP